MYYERQWGDEVVHVRLLLAHHWNAAGHKRFASLYVEQAAQAALNDALFSSALDLVAEATALLMEGTDADIAFTDDGRLDTDSLPAAISEASDGGGDLTSGGGSEESLTGATRPLEGERHPDYERFGTHQAICAAGTRVSPLFARVCKCLFWVSECEGVSRFFFFFFFFFFDEVVLQRRS